VTIDKSQKPGLFGKLKNLQGYKSEAWKNSHDRENPDEW
jgi:hypothetical protein